MKRHVRAVRSIDKQVYNMDDVDVPRRTSPTRQTCLLRSPTQQPNRRIRRHDRRRRTHHLNSCPPRNPKLGIAQRLMLAIHCGCLEPHNCHDSRSRASNERAFKTCTDYLDTPRRIRSGYYADNHEERDVVPGRARQPTPTTTQQNQKQLPGTTDWGNHDRHPWNRNLMTKQPLP